METYRTWVRLFELQRHYSWLVDRFHLSTIAYQRTARGLDVDFCWLEERIGPLGFHVGLFVRTPESFEAARVERLRVSGKPEQYDDLSVFVREQDVLRELAARSALPVREFDVSDGDVARVCDEVCDWMTGTGGLWAPGDLDPWVPEA
jgi:thymidylate kinase